VKQQQAIERTGAFWCELWPRTEANELREQRRRSLLRAERCPRPEIASGKASAANATLESGSHIPTVIL
jgi:hypothetical protein